MSGKTTDPDSDPELTRESQIAGGLLIGAKAQGVACVLLSVAGTLPGILFSPVHIDRLCVVQAAGTTTGCDLR